MSQRIKLKTAAPKTREEMEQLVGEIAAMKIEERRLKALLDEHINGLKDSYLPQISRCNEVVAARMPAALAWAEAHPEDFGRLRSIEILHGTIGWRTNTPSLKTLSGWTWDRVLDVVKKLPALTGYIRTREEMNRQALLNDRDALGTDGLRALGLKVVQEDEFYVEPKLTETATREVAS